MRPEVFFFVFVTIITVGAEGKTNIECTAELLELLGTDVRECVRRQEEAGEAAREVFPGEIYQHEALCLMINKIVNKCGEMWRSCYTTAEVREIQRLELSSLKEQYRTKMDYSRCGASLEIEDGSGEAGALQTNDDTYTANMTSGVIDDYYDRELSDYNIVIDTKDMSDTEDTQSSGGGNCDQHSCKVELQTTGQTQSLGFFGAITKLLQPLFTLSY